MNDSRRGLYLALLGVWSLIALGSFVAAMMGALSFASPNRSLDGLIYLFYGFGGFVFAIIPVSGYLRLVKGRSGGGERVYAPCLLPLLGLVPSLPLALNGFTALGLLHLLVVAFLAANVVVGLQAKARWPTA